ncbi:MAG: class I SAM-dependent DNA methyltransferase [Actinomycetota bacterium]|nr:class I SAM-dependent DNA methyltransferase [Actinomycetota bacterium]
MTRISPQEFAARWEKSSLSERASYQPHFLDLCDMLDAPKPSEEDPSGDFYTFEKGVEKTGGGKGFADVWRKDFFAIEYKGKHRDLGSAYSQLLHYRESLGNPPLLVVTDIDRFEVHTNFTGTVPAVYRFSNREIGESANLRVLRAMFEDPYSLRPSRTVESVTEEAASKFALLADGMRARGVEPRAAARFLNKLLFCLFAEDIGLLPKGLFTEVVQRGVRKKETFNRNIGHLFEAMADGGEFALRDILRFNGGLFEDAEVVELVDAEIRVLLEAARLDWGAVEPAIFGTLFERSLDPSQRARLGAHYTGREDILAVVEPVLMAPLRREWDEVRGRAAKEADDARGQSGRKAENTLRRAEAGLREFAGRLAAVRVLDPACGSGNFLYVALRELLDLEKEVSAYAGEIGLTPFFPEVGPRQLFGVETSPYAHELAQVAVWIGYLQWTRDNGFGRPEEPILGPMTNIKWMDAVLSHDEAGNPIEPEWPEADVIIGNPPFLGGKRMRSELDDAYVDDLFALYQNRVPREADLVTYWFEKARSLISDGKLERAGLLATNSIRGGANRRVLQRIKETGDIFFAESDRPWILNGAAVRVSMVGFDDGSEGEKMLDGAPADAVNSDLTGALDLTSASRLAENSNLAFMGDTKGGPFDLSPDIARKLLSATGNPNGRPNTDVIRPWVNGLDITRRPRGFHIIDFGTEMSLEDAALYEAPFEYVNEHVRPKREKSRSTRSEWWLHERPRVDMRRALNGMERFIVTPSVAKYRLFAWSSPPTLVDHAAFAFARDDDYFFGVLHSRAHEIWSLRMGRSLEDRPRYTPTTCFETFPLPWPPGGEPEGDVRVEAISEAARRLDELRRRWLDPEGASEPELKKRTLTNLYNARPTWLENAHRALDGAVFEAYGWTSDITDEDILKELLAMNAERSEGGR